MTVPDKMAGKTGKCKCGYKLTVPSGNSDSEPTKPQKAVAAAGADGASAPPESAPSSGLASVFDDLTESDFQRTSPYEQLYSPSTSNNDRATLKRFADDSEERAEKAKGANGMIIFVAVLNFLNALVCGGLAVLLVVAASFLQKIEASIPELSLGIGVGIAFFSLTATVLIAGGVGLLMRKPWGWFLVSMSYAYFLVVRLADMVMVFVEGFEQGPFFGALIPLLAAVSLSAWIFKEDTRQLFGVKKSLIGWIAAGIGVVLAGVMLLGLYLLVQSASDSLDTVDDADDFLDGGEARVRAPFDLGPLHAAPNTELA